jgi:hypothetical protein
VGDAKKKLAVKFKVQLIVGHRTMGLLWKIKPGNVAYSIAIPGLHGAGSVAIGMPV